MDSGAEIPISSIELIPQVYSRGLGAGQAEEAWTIGALDLVTLETIVIANSTVVRCMTTVTARMAAICGRGFGRGMTAGDAMEPWETVSMTVRNVARSNGIASEQEITGRVRRFQVRDEKNRRKKGNDKDDS